MDSPTVARQRGCWPAQRVTKATVMIDSYDHPRQRPAKLSREEPDAGNLHVRVCGRREWQHPRLPGGLLARGFSDPGFRRAPSGLRLVRNDGERAEAVP